MVVGYLIMLVIAFAFFYPMWTGGLLTTPANEQRVWLDLVELTIAWR
jgi:hypothetical protein